MATRDDAVGAARERAERARALVDAGAYLVTPGAVLVYSDAPSCPGWTVSGGVCPCPDATVGVAARLLDGACKHRMVSELVAALQRSAPKRLQPPGAESFVRPPADLGPFKPERPRRLPPTDADAWLEAQDDRQRAARLALAEIDKEMAR